MSGWHVVDGGLSLYVWTYSCQRRSGRPKAREVLLGVWTQKDKMRGKGNKITDSWHDVMASMEVNIVES